MMKVVIPLRVEPIAAKLLRPNDPCVVESAFRDQVDAPIQEGALAVYGVRQIFKEDERRVIEFRMHCIEAKTIEVIVRDPLDCVRDEKMPYLVAVCSVEVDCRTPRSSISVCKIRSKLRKIVSFRSEVVVDHV